MVSLQAVEFELDCLVDRPHDGVVIRRQIDAGRMIDARRFLHGLKARNRAAASSSVASRFATQTRSRLRRGGFS